MKIFLIIYRELPLYLLVLQIKLYILWDGTHFYCGNLIIMICNLFSHLDTD